MPATRAAGPPEGLRRFLGRFGRGEYWLAHEELEEVWLADRRDVYKGLIQLAAACLHHERGNDHGTRAKLTSARELIDSDQNTVQWVDREGLIALVERLLAGDWPPRVDLTQVVHADPADAELEAEELPYRVTRYAQGYRPGRDPRRRD